MMEWRQVAQSREVREKLPKKVYCNGEQIAVYRHQGRLYALLDRCLHQGAPLSDGYAENNYAVCSYHGWRFALEDGHFQNNPAGRIPVYPVKEENGLIYIGFGSELPAGAGSDV